ncbi:hypothetical protein NCCP2331_28810 [Sporosarcina sp. NCCP-2331]|nr:hypothetical protein NCCP2331_28810 [Sporosarcina sp. NCCP-2331]GLB57089.1 hypothetical protein NCCP2378_28760 [Sporosarcina sp. NCCP-2378]
MGEYAEMILDGSCCDRCGEFLGSPSGYPGMCQDCHHEWSATETEKLSNQEEI